MPQIKHALSRLDEIKDKNEEASFLVSLLDAYRNSRFSILPDDVIAKKVIPFIYDDEVRNIHIRVAMYITYLCEADKSCRPDQSYEVQKAILYGKEIDKRLERFKTPENLSRIVSANSFYLSAKDCESFLNYIATIRTINFNTRSVPSAPEYSLYKHQFPVYKRKAYEFFLDARVNLITGGSYGVCISRLYVTVILTNLIAYSTLVILADKDNSYEDARNASRYSLLSFVALLFITACIAPVCAYRYHDRRNGFRYPRIGYNDYIYHKNKLRDNFEIHVMVDTLCSQIENKCANNPQSLGIRLEDNIEERSLIYLHKYDQHISEPQPQRLLRDYEHVDLEMGVNSISVRFNI